MNRQMRFTVRRGLLSALAVAVTTTGVLATGNAIAAGPDKPTQLAVLSVTDEGTGLNRPVRGKPFDVVVQSQVAGGVATVVTKNTTVELSVVTGDGQLSGITTAVISKGSSTATIAGAIYSIFENEVELLVSVTKGEDLTPASRTVNVQAVAAAAAASPHVATSLTPSDCVDTTPALPTCATLLLPNGASGTVFLSEGSCAGIVDCRAAGDVQSLLVDATVNLKDESGNPLYSRGGPATLEIHCDKSLCGGTGVPHVALLVDILGDDNFVEAPECPSRGVISADPTTPPFCVDHRQSHRDNAGDLITPLLFAIDVRASHP